MKTLIVAALLSVCLKGRQNSEAGKLARLPVLTADDLTRQFQKSREELYARYHGKEVIVLCEAGFQPRPRRIHPEG
jgi:hypothetical protein